jgi:predicted ATPase
MLDGKTVTDFESIKVQALLVYLAVESDRPHSRESLAGFLWPDQPGGSARKNLRQALFNLRQSIQDREAEPPFLQITRRTIQFNRESDHWLDAAAFSTHVAACEAHLASGPLSERAKYPDPTVSRRTQDAVGALTFHHRTETCAFCIGHLEQAIALYRGSFLEGVFVDESVLFQDWTLLWRERFHRLALDALYDLTTYYERCRAYSRARRYARRQVELEPWREEAHQQLIRLLARCGQRSAALAQYDICRRILADELRVEPHRETTALYHRVLAARSAQPHNLPRQLTTLIGREQELSEIAQRLADPECRFLTLTGLGGVGKTRLALRAAREQIGAFLHGVYFVSLAATSSTAFLASAIADAVGFTFSGEEDPKTQLLNYLREKEMLLVLDSFEHLLDGVQMLLDILKHASGIKIVVTSQERLVAQAEWVFQVQGLPFPEELTAEPIEGYSAVRLFLNRARRVKAGFSLSATTAPAVLRICRLVEGMPLGIELAAASTLTSSCGQIAAQIEHNLDALATSMQDVSERHRSMRAALEHSWTLLSRDERAVLRKLAVFRGGFEALAARSVAASFPQTLSSLLRKSLLRRRAGDGRGDCYEIHELVRQFVAEKLDEHPVEKQAAFQGHCAYYASFLHRKEASLKTGDQTKILAEISAEIENVRVAWQWAVAHRRLEEIDLALESLYYFYWARNLFYEGEQALQQAERIVGDTGEEIKLLAARIWTRQAEFDYWLARYDEAHIRLEKSLGVCRSLRAQGELALALDLLGRIEYLQAEYRQAEQHVQESLRICRQIGDKVGAAQALNALANVTCEMSADYDRARSLYEESLTIAREIGDQFGVARALINLGALAQELGNYREAKRFYEESLRIYRAIGYRHGQSASLSYLGQVASLLGEHALAQELLQESLSMNRETGDRHAIAERLKQLGRVACRMGAHAESKGFFNRALDLAIEIQAISVVLDTLIGVADLFQREGKKGSALELLAFVAQQTESGRELQDRARALIPACEMELTPQTVSGPRERSRIRTLQEAVSLALDGSVSQSFVTRNRSSDASLRL